MLRGTSAAGAMQKLFSPQRYEKVADKYHSVKIYTAVN